MNHKIKNCITDARVSTDKQLQGSGLDDQERICEYYVKQKGWNNLETFSKSYSGRKEEREDFERIKLIIKSYQSRGVSVDFYVVKSIDRLTRLGSDVYIKMQEELHIMGVQLVDTRNIIQPQMNTLEHTGFAYEWSVIRPSRKSEIFESEKASEEVTDILTRMIGAEIGLTQKGFSMRAPNDGYSNTKEIVGGKEMSVAKQNSDRSHFYKIMFEMRASGKYSDQEIVARVNSLGFKSIPHKKWKKLNEKEKIVIGISQSKIMTVKQFQKVIKRVIYAGIKNEKWNKEPVWLQLAAGENAIVDVDTFNRANRGAVFIKVDGENTPSVLYNFTEKERNVKTRKKYNPDYIYDKMVVCGECNKPLKNSGKGNKGKVGKYYQGYHCDRTTVCKKITGRIAKQKYNSEIALLLEGIEFNDDFKDKLEARLIKKYREREKEVLGQSISISENVVDLKRKQESLLNDFSNTTSDVVRRHIESQVENLEYQISLAVEERDRMEVTERDVKAFVKYVKNLVEHPAKMLANNKNPYTQAALFDLVFEEPLTYTQVISGTPKLSFIFKLSSTPKSEESSLVIPRRIELRFHGWEPCVLAVRRWDQMCPGICMPEYGVSYSKNLANNKGVYWYRMEQLRRPNMGAVRYV